MNQPLVDTIQSEEQPVADSSSLFAQIKKRRSFAIIAHPDAGKTTLTEKLLLFGGAIQLAGAVKARGEQRRARSDWMKVEKERGISVTVSVMSFSFANCAFNLLDTPGHEDFSEDTYRTLTAVDSAVMVLDAAKGIETQTRKLFEVCRLRDIPIITFINKMDRESLDPLSLLDDISQGLALDVCPITWPIGQGRDFKGCYHLLEDKLYLMPRNNDGKLPTTQTLTGIDDPNIAALLGENVAQKLREDVAMARALCPPFNHEAYLAGHLTPVFFGSAISNFGVKELLEGLANYAPSPRNQTAVERLVVADEDKVTGFVFKIQANMDPRHRDRMVFLRLTSGRFRRGMKLQQARTGRFYALNQAVLFLAQDRALAEEAFAGDIIGIPMHGGIRIGDAFTEGEKLSFTGIPSFAPELLQRIRPKDPLKAKHLSRALEELAQEGVARVFRPAMGADWVVGVVGSLQFDVLSDRLRTEYTTEAILEPVALYTARWVEGEKLDIKKFEDSNQSALAHDHDDMPVFLARNAWHLDQIAKDWPMLSFKKNR
ncbi:MAG: peptide chain release factor 3 [Alphaproteobacteria bacterium]